MSAVVLDLLDIRARADGPVVQVRLVAFERADGKVVWDRETLVWTGDDQDARRFDWTIVNALTDYAERWGAKVRASRPGMPPRRRARVRRGVR